MANWTEIYKWAEDRHLEMLQKRAERRRAQKEQQSQQTSSQATTGTTTMSNPRLIQTSEESASAADAQ